MNYFGQTCKQLLFKILLSLYLVANFSVPIFEGIHFLMHLTDKTKIHSFQAHSTAHSHSTLDLIDNLLVENNSTESPNTSDSSIKSSKIIQFLVDNFSLTKDFVFYPFKNFQSIITLPQSPFIKINSPPPNIQIT